jgi:hypothetical protein
METAAGVQEPFVGTMDSLKLHWEVMRTFQATKRGDPDSDDRYSGDPGIRFAASDGKQYPYHNVTVE